MDCGCIRNEEELTIIFCRECAMNVEQGSDEWSRARLGWLTASRASDAFAKNRQGNGPGVTQLNYRAELVCERLNGFAYEGFHNRYMDRGKEEEELAVLAYEIATRQKTQSVGFVQHLLIRNFGASPDRRIGDVGLVEVKNRKTAIHFELLKTRTVAADDATQVLTELACAEWAEFCDYVSHDSRAPAGCDLFVKRFYREDYEGRIAEIEERGQEFLYDVEKQARELQGLALSGFIFLEREKQPNGNLMAQLTGSLAMARESVVVPIRRKGRK